jgi:predicted nucleotide-binding protein
MAKPTIVSESTYLNKSKIVFKKEIENRIDRGNEMLLVPPETINDLIVLKEELSSWHDYNLELLKQSFNEPCNEYRKHYEEAGSWRKKHPNGQSFAEQTREFTCILNARLGNLKKLVEKTELLKTRQHDVQVRANRKTELDMSQVFIVHGHDKSAKEETARFIEKLGFKPILLHEQASSGKTIIEKIESYSNVGFGIVLYTPCDIGTKKGEETNWKDRARQNVVFEHGYLIGKIGRSNVSALVKGDIETPNDISGVVYISMESEWKIDLAKELRNSGYEVDMNLVI